MRPEVIFRRKISDINPRASKDRMNAYFLCLGGNSGDREANLARATGMLGSCGTIASCSSLYETEAWGMSGPAFLNQVICYETDLSPFELLDLIFSIEDALGRASRTGVYADRPMDIDILLAGDLVLDSPRVTIPHPRMSERRFVLVPLCEIAPQTVHPVTRETVRAMLARCADPLGVRAYHREP